MASQFLLIRAKKLRIGFWRSVVDLVQGFGLCGNVIVGSQIDFLHSIGVTPTIGLRIHSGGAAGISDGRNIGAAHGFIHLQGPHTNSVRAGPGTRHKKMKV